MSGNRNWCFTSYAENLYIDALNDKIQYMISQKEKCPKTGKLHYQGYIEFKGKMRMNEVKKLMSDNSVHLEPRRGTQKQAIDYCRKEETRVEEPKEFGEPKQQGKRSDIDDIYDDIAEGDTLNEILQNHKGNAIRMIHAIEKAAKIHYGFNEMDAYILAKRRVALLEIEIEGIRKLKEKATADQLQELYQFEYELGKAKRNLKGQKRWLEPPNYENEE